MTMAHVHELLYRSDDLESIDLAEYLGRIVSDLEYAGGAQGRVQAELQRVECSMDCCLEAAGAQRGIGYSRSATRMPERLIYSS